MVERVVDLDLELECLAVGDDEVETNDTAVVDWCRSRGNVRRLGGLLRVVSIRHRIRWRCVDRDSEDADAHVLVGRPGVRVRRCAAVCEPIDDLVEEMVDDGLLLAVGI